MGRPIAVYRTRSQALVFLGLGLFFSIFVVVFVVSYIQSPNLLALLVQEAIFLPMTWLYFRSARAGIYVLDGGIRIVNPLRTSFVEWDAVRCFRRGEGGFFPKVAFAVLCDGTEVRIFGIQGPNPATRPHNRDAEHLIDQLNAALSRRNRDAWVLHDR